MFRSKKRKRFLREKSVSSSFLSIRNHHHRSCCQEDLSKVERLLCNLISCATSSSHSDEDQEALQNARLLLCLLLIQGGRSKEAKRLLLEQGFLYRLSDEVLVHSNLPLATTQPEVVYAVDNALPPLLLQHLQTAFHPESVFWKEHNYSTNPPSPYFSYLHDLTKKKKKLLGIEQIFLYIQKICAQYFPSVNQARFAE
jgi:hypothetical protein